MKFRFSGAFYAASLGALVLGGCDRGEDIVGPGNGTEATFARIQSEIFDQSCVGCHRGGSSGPGALDLSSADVSYANLVNVPANHVDAAGLTRVVPNDPDASFLVMKLEGGPDLAGDRMPFGGAPLPAAEIQLVRDWIAAGAPRE